MELGIVLLRFDADNLLHVNMVKYFFFSSHKNEIGALLLLHLISDRNPHM